MSCLGLSGKKKETMSDDAPTSPISRVLASPDHFTTLQLDAPEASLSGRQALFDYDAGEVRRKFRRLSVQVHPDKHGGIERAQQAFDKLREAYACLNDPALRTGYLREYAKAHGERLRAAARASAVGEDSVEAAARIKAKEKRIAAQQVGEFKSRMRGQLRERLEKQRMMKRKQARRLIAVKQRCHGSGPGAITTSNTNNRGLL